MKSSPPQNDADKLARIKRLAQAHATPASNIGCHQLALKILKIIDTSDEQPDLAVLLGNEGDFWREIEAIRGDADG